MSKHSYNGRKMAPAVHRLKQDYMRLMRDPVPYVVAHPNNRNILEWHYIVRGPENTPYENGIYHGKLVFPSEFPFKPPSIYMLTPNGRFQCNVRLCLSISDYHPDTWNPAWSVSTILTGLLSFMLEKKPTMGSIESSDYEKHMLAKRSWSFNLKDPIFCELFPDVVEEIKEKLKSASTVSDRMTELSYSFRSNGFRTGNENGGVFTSTITNIIIIITFVAFIYTVKYVLKAIANIEDNSL